MVKLAGVTYTPKALAARLVAATLHHQFIAMEMEAHFKQALAGMTDRERAQFERHKDEIVRQILTALGKINA